MKRPDPLFSLIKCLSKSEKRYFRLYASLHEIGDKNNYLKLFDELAKTEEYDEDEIRRKFAGEVFLKQLHVTKNYLSKLILKALRNFNSEISVETEVRKLFDDVENLYHKLLFDQCRKILDKIEETAGESENHLVLAEVNRWRSHLNQRTDAAEDFDAFRTHHDEQIKYTRVHLNILEYRRLAVEIFYRIRTSGIARTKDQVDAIEKVIRHPLLKDEKQALSFRAKHNFYQIHTVYHIFKGEMHKAHNYQLKIVAHVEANPGQIKKKPNFYLVSLQNLADSFTIAKKFHEAEKLVDKIKSITAKYDIRETRDWKSRMLSAICHIETMVFRSSGDFEKGHSKISGITEELKKYRKGIEPSALVFIHYNLACICFGAEQFSESLSWLSEIFNNTSKNLRTDILSAARILQVVVYFETNSDETLPYAIKNAERFLKNSNKFFSPEKATLDFFKKAYKLRHDKVKMKDELELFLKNMMKLSRQKTEGNLLENFDLIAWAKKKIKANV